MNIYFACSITGGREFEPVYRALVAALQGDGHIIPTAHLASSGVSADAVLSPVQVYERDTAWIRLCDALIAEVSIPSHGVGYEMGYALMEGKPVLCLCREGQGLSKMISGNPDPGLQLKFYAETGQAISLAREYAACQAL